MKDTATEKKCPVCGHKIPKLTLSAGRVAEVYKLVKNKIPEEVAKLTRLSLGTIGKIAEGRHLTQKRMVKITPAKIDRYHAVRTVYKKEVSYQSEHEADRLHTRPLADFPFNLKVIKNIRQIITDWQGGSNLKIEEFGPDTLRWGYAAGDTQTFFYFKPDGVYAIPGENTLEWAQLQNRSGIAVSMIRKAERILYETPALQSKLDILFELPWEKGK